MNEKNDKMSLVDLFTDTSEMNRFYSRKYMYKFSTSNINKATATVKKIHFRVKIL